MNLRLWVLRVFRHWKAGRDTGAKGLQPDEGCYPRLVERRFKP